MISTILICVGLFVVAVSLIAIVILDAQMANCDKHLKEIDELLWHLEHGTPIEEVLKMPMPKKLRKELTALHEQEMLAENKNISNNFLKK